MSLVIPTQPTPNNSFTSAMPTSLQLAPTPSLIGPSQIQTKPPSVQPASSPTPATLSVNNQKSPANSRTTSSLVSLSPIEAVERTTLQKSSIIHKSFEDMDASVPLRDTVCIHHTRFFRQITAKGVPARLSVSPRQIDFGARTISTLAKPLHKLSVTLVNTEHSPLKWRIDASNTPEIQADIFQKEEAEYKLSIPLFLNAEKSEYSDITVAALGIKQQLVFEPKELFLQPVPLVLSAVLSVLAQQGPPPLHEHVFRCLSHFCLAGVDERAIRAAAVGSARGHPRREDPGQTACRNHADDDDDWKHNPRSPASFFSDQNSDVALKTATPTARNRDPQRHSLPQTMSSTPNACRRSSRSCGWNACVSSRFHYPVPDVNEILFAVQKSQ
ncbi:hypothetical protein BLNAU_11867 [Blattamonas nauphoetae]|uniref:Uncharacterized protein n=1 Tax=Blattamonas nauphoetae TaxID=2049346 RepID=A0ABQ9XLD8_9EUKA|nr:hypothetical protein BLNAU_11867 [Blattamonas nauphoetae]